METTQTWLAQAHKNAGWVVVLGIAEIILGILVIVSPLAGGLAVTMFIGAGLIIGGLIRLFAAFGAESFGAGTLTFLWGLLVAASGFYITVNPGIGLATLTLVLAVMFFASGLTQIFVAMKMRPILGWGWTLTSGILTVVFAFMIQWQFPFSGLWLVGTLVGIHLMFAGMSTFTVGSAARTVTADDRVGRSRHWPSFRGAVAAMRVMVRLVSCAPSPGAQEYDLVILNGPG